MHNVFIIIRREYIERVRTKAFWIMTMLVPALMAGITILPAKLMMTQAGEKKKLAVVSSDRGYGETLEKSLADLSKDVGRNQYTVEIVTPGTPEQEKQLYDRVARGELDGYLWATDDALASKKLVYKARTTTDMLEGGPLMRAAQAARLEQQLAAAGMNAEKVHELLNEKLEVETERVAAGKSTKASGRAAFFATFALVMTLYMSIILHGVAVMRSVLEEKTSRIVEVLLASVTPKELMAGKIIGVGAVGLTQLALWYAAGFVFVGPGLLAARGVMGPIEIPPVALAMFPVFFLLGYFLYASLWAMLGAMSNSEQEAQQMQFFVMLPLILSTVLMGPAITSPNSTMVAAFSLFPFCTPLLMYVRIAAGEVPVWQLALSIVLMVAAVYVVLVVASRIYRVGILMYGKRPTLPELIKWFKYA
ncbi:MAG: ABC transporter permease [Candidatus Koribacter versatilis]|uniref:ABC transporter permease n=1 Tax=Candidatus Korobacter versatilis TaxID=658062 RepID=A0A932EPJ1_9BACT|nr:ABC transporter permease [Candidatus Koribacter versatilis]